MVVDAPGKIVVLGEYAVVDGAPAIVRAVDRGVRCTVTPADVLAWSTPTDDDRFVARALEAVGAPAAHYAFSDWRPVEATDKVGLGGSAAATVAAVVAAWRVAGRVFGPDDVLSTAHAVHNAVQGSGSGIDVAASAHGGWIRFEQRAVAAIDARPPVTVVYSGRPAATGPRVRKYLALDAVERAAFVAQSRRIVEGFEEAPVEAIRAGGALLRSMAERAGIAYWTESIDRLVQLAAAHGGAGKPSGAGGGDIVVAVFADAAARSAYEAAARASGFLVIDVATSAGATFSGTGSEMRGR
ncbi:MAG: hypothetical protein AAF602_15755 [Myxococcota bacterium]